MYAKLYRTAIRLAVCLAALGSLPVVHAGYAQLAPPAGFSASGSGFAYAAAANDKVFGGVIHQPNGLTTNVAGRAVSMPASYRLAANAPRIAARVIFMHPAVRVGAGVAAWLGAGLIWDQINRRWTAPDPDAVPSDGYEYRVSTTNVNAAWEGSIAAACASQAGYLSNPLYNVNASQFTYSFSRVDGTRCYIGVVRVSDGAKLSDSQFTVSRRIGSCPAGWYQTPAGCVQNTPVKHVLEEEFIDDLAKRPMPSTVPQELPYPTPLPVEQPFINPAPGENPEHRPQFVPTGNPVKNPNYDPSQAPGPANQPYLQPGVRIVPVPTPNSPWQVDMQPVDRPVGSADPKPDPQPDPEPGDGDKPKPEDQQSLCEKHPDILACSKPELDIPEDEIPRETRDVSYQPESLFGGGVCPSNKTMSTHGMQLTVWDWQESCGYITSYFRPVILVLCAIAAFFIVTGGARQS